jgi:hypothetical protein
MNNRTQRTVAYQEDVSVINQETGEVTLEKKMKQYKASVEPNYIKLYIDDIDYFNHLNIKSVLLYEVLKEINYRHEIVINHGVKKRMADSIGKSLSYVNNNLTKLIKDEVLIRVDKGIYQLNSYLLGKGGWKDILKHRQSLDLNKFYNYDSTKGGI